MAVCWIAVYERNTTQRGAAILTLIRDEYAINNCAAGVALLVILMIGFKVNGFIALVLVAAVVDLPEGMGAQNVCSIQNRWRYSGRTRHDLGFGAMLGRLISDTGA